MRLWSLHPRLLDPKGLVALWREGLLARKVLAGETVGYKHHPQLQRFRGPYALQRIDSYLHVVCDEATRRGYKFDRSKLKYPAETQLIEVTRGQVIYEHGHLNNKLIRRTGSPLVLDVPRTVPVHPLFVAVNGPIEEWERP